MKNLADVNPLNNATQFAQRLVKWYRKEARELPWRKTQNPYEIFVSEVMLQQTPVERVLLYYSTFLSQFPDVQTLVAAPESELLRVWSGLGYYRRARLLQQAAKEVVHTYNGTFPSDPALLRRLPGIGRYTANAIASFAFGRAVPVVETNSARVLMRLFAVRGTIRSQEKQLWRLAEELVPKRFSRTYNYAIMELGSLVCLSREPLCHRCAVAEFCLGMLRGVQKQIPQVQKAPPTEREEWDILLLTRQGIQPELLVRLIPEREWHAGFYGFPVIKRKTQIGDNRIRRLYKLKFLCSSQLLGRVTFTVTNHNVTARVILCDGIDSSAAQLIMDRVKAEKWEWVPMSDLLLLTLALPYRKALNLLDVDESGQGDHHGDTGTDG